MQFGSDEHIDRPTAVGNDSGLCCPECEYNLTGLPLNRCPECGAPFDPEELRKLLLGVPQPIPIWDDRARIGVMAAFFRTCWMTWFHPAEFARGFPSWHDQDAVVQFWLLTRLVAIAPMIVASIVSLCISARPSENVPGVLTKMVIWSLMAGAGVVSASLICETVLACILAVAAKPKRGPRNSAPWFGLVAMNGSYLVLTVNTCVLSEVLATVTGLGGYAMHRPLAFALLLGTTWWWHAIIRAALIVARPDTGRTVALSLLCLMAAGSTCLCILLLFS